ncbi:single-stranded DNA-binding protein [Geotoga petraea]|uniref:Single-stranded DNA-binding protein n=1 Tax=Geotoga petraea TaxID=28234 RepID=A0A1G6LSS2_9BACT|nr:single-stranded DNA-binding protein [Geotoga petraea]SDC45746.1 single-strand binding protein [Geotoga petraea]
MSIAYNKIILIGRLTRDPEIRSTVSGSSVANFSLAVDRQSKNNNDVDFINIVAFGRQADFASNYLSKGKLILVEGQLRINKWTDRNDVKRETAEVWANRMAFMETKKAQNQNIQQPTQNNQYNDEMPGFDEDPFEDIENDLDTNTLTR